MSTAERLEELRDLPRVTKADRAVYQAWETQARAELALYEPKHIRDERDQYRRDRYDRFLWRTPWRSLPDYDGPPMRAPSGTDYHRVFRADGSSRVAIPLRVEGPSFVGNAQLAALFGEVEEISTAWRNNDNYITVMPLFARPSEGGRGWCPKLAGVNK